MRGHQLHGIRREVALASRQSEATFVRRCEELWRITVRVTKSGQYACINNAKL